MKTLEGYAQYLVNKCQGDVDFAMKIQRNHAELELKNPDNFERDVEVLQCLEVIKTNKKST